MQLFSTKICFSECQHSIFPRVWHWNSGFTSRSIFPIFHHFRPQRPLLKMQRFSNSSNFLTKVDFFDQDSERPGGVLFDLPKIRKISSRWYFWAFWTQSNQIFYFWPKMGFAKFLGGNRALWNLVNRVSGTLSTCFFLAKIRIFRAELRSAENAIFRRFPLKSDFDEALTFCSANELF